MIQTEAVTIDGKEYKRTYSDSGYMIERDGEMYEDAIDPIDIEREYVETNIPIANEEISDAEALRIITEGVV